MSQRGVITDASMSSSAHRTKLFVLTVFKDSEDGGNVHFPPASALYWN